MLLDADRNDLFPLSSFPSIYFTLSRVSAFGTDNISLVAFRFSLFVFLIVGFDSGPLVAALYHCQRSTTLTFSRFLLLFLLFCIVRHSTPCHCTVHVQPITKSQVQLPAILIPNIFCSLFPVSILLFPFSFFLSLAHSLSLLFALLHFGNEEREFGL